MRLFILDWVDEKQSTKTTKHLQWRVFWLRLQLSRIPALLLVAMVNGTKIGNWSLRTSCTPSTSPSHSTTTAFTNDNRVCGTKTGYWRFVRCCHVAITPRNVALNLFGYYLVANKLNAPCSNAVGLVLWSEGVWGDSWLSNSSCLFSCRLLSDSLNTYNYA